MMRVVFAKRHSAEHKTVFGDWSFDESQPFIPVDIPQLLPTAVALEIYRWINERKVFSLRTSYQHFLYEWIVCRSNWASDKSVQESGYALCIREPNGDYGLEGYNEGQLVPYQKCYGKIGSRVGGYMRVWPGDDPDSSYYETIGSHSFLSYFDPNTFLIWSNNELACS